MNLSLLGFLPKNMELQLFFACPPPAATLLPISCYPPPACCPSTCCCTTACHCCHPLLLCTLLLPTPWLPLAHPPTYLLPVPAAAHPAAPTCSCPHLPTATASCHTHAFPPPVTLMPPHLPPLPLCITPIHLSADLSWCALVNIKKIMDARSLLHQFLLDQKWSHNETYP